MLATYTCIVLRICYVHLKSLSVTDADVTVTDADSVNSNVRCLIIVGTTKHDTDRPGSGNRVSLKIFDIHLPFAK